MRPALALCLFALGAMGLAGCVRDALPEPTPAETPQESAPPGIAVVELFTSEGCSSCPPADALLAELVAEDTPGLIALAFHVDYWDRLGWRDPFGSAAHSERQRAIARTLDGRVYTPQAVVNGTEGVVGSREGAVRGQIAAALAEPAPVSVSLDARADGQTVTATPTIGGAPEGAVLHVALAQREAEQSVPRGENRGRTLRHVHVVRDVASQPAARAEPLTLAIPDGLAPADVLVAAYVQTGETGAILGAAQADL